jgi:LysM repeat protein
VPSITPTPTTVPSPTPEPPIEYTVGQGDTCGSIAFFFDVTVRSLIELNNLGTECFLTVGQRILVPVPTPAPTDTPTATLAPAEATEAACPKITYTVEAGDTLFGIAQNYNVAMDDIKQYNGLTSDNVFSGQILIVPLCRRLGGPTPTPTVPPPYPAPNLLLPKDGESFSLANDTISLQWAAVAPLREDEFYQVTVVDVTEESLGSGRKSLVEYVKDTQFNLPTSFRPSGSTPHVMRWWVETVRLTGTSATGEPRYVSAGAASLKRDFTWSGSAIGTPTP